MWRFTGTLLGALLVTGMLGADDPPAVKGERDGDKRDGERKPGEREDGSLRAVVKTMDLAKGVITVVISGDGGSTVRSFNLAGKDIKVTGVAEKLSELREGLQVYLKLSADEDVLAIRSEKAKRFSKAGRIFAAYDKSGDDKVVFEEWLQMKEGVLTPARKAAERSYFDRADGNRDGSVGFAEFENWLENRGRQPEAGARPGGDLPNPIRKDEK